MLSIYLSMVETDEDKDKIAYIYETYYSSMAFSAGSVLGHNSSYVEDVVHDAMIKIMEILPQIDFSQPNRVECLCSVIAKNRARDHFKHKGNHGISIDEAITESVEDDSCPYNILMEKETYAEILRAIYSLDEKYRDVCILKYVNKLKEKEIARVLSLPSGTVSVRIQRGRQLLKESIRKGDS